MFGCESNESSIQIGVIDGQLYFRRLRGSRKSAMLPGAQICGNLQIGGHLVGACGLIQYQAAWATLRQIREAKSNNICV